MQLNIARWGNSLAVRLPSHLAKESKLTEGAAVSIELRDGSLVITPVRKKYSLAELLAKMPTDARPIKEFDWGQPQGDEVW